MDDKNFFINITYLREINRIMKRTNISFKVTKKYIYTKQNKKTCIRKFKKLSLINQGEKKGRERGKFNVTINTNY